MVKWLILLILNLLSLSNFLYASDNKRIRCSDYLVGANTDEQIAVIRVESLLGKQIVITDVSESLTETRAHTDPTLRVINLGDIFTEGHVFLGFGRPNVYTGIPNPEDNKLNFQKVDAKSLKRADTQLVKTHNRVQSGLLVVFKGLSPEAVSQIYQAAQVHVGSRRWTCVNANCRIFSDAGFTLGGESLANYYFPVALLRDILRYGLEFQGQPVEFDVIKTTPGYLEDIGLSISHAVRTTLCRHAERSCLLVRIRRGFESTLGLATFRKEDANPGPIERPVYESKRTSLQISPDDERDYRLDVSEPSQFGTLLRLIWGPHSLFEVSLPRATVDTYLPNALHAYPDESPSVSTRIKKNILFNPGVINFIRSQLSKTYRSIEGMTQSTLFGMLRTDSDELPNKYNFVLTGDRLIVIKIAGRNSLIDWVLSKHVLMSQYSDDVRMAGEIWKDANGVIHFNINSGTYKPGPDLVDKGEELFKEIFPGMSIQGERTVD